MCMYARGGVCSLRGHATKRLDRSDLALHLSLVALIQVDSDLSVTCEFLLTP
eukprot:m.24382 g.24382  ORF g.24382 m.24382 type:complete len:52 (+) comp14578_c0_seq1:288-443(+)